MCALIQTGVHYSVAPSFRLSSGIREHFLHDVVLISNPSLKKLNRYRTDKDTKSMNTLGRKSSFRTPRMKKIGKAPSSVSNFAIPYDSHNQTITPMLSKKSELWRGSVGQLILHLNSTIY